MKKFLEIIFKIICSVLILVAVNFGLKLLVEYLDSTDLGWVWFTVSLMIIAIIMMIVSGISVCRKRKKKASSNKEIDMDEKNSKVVDINVNKETVGGITLFEVLFYVISVVFAIWIVNAFKEIGEVFAKIELIKMHFIWLGVFDAFLFIQARTPRIQSKAMLYVYTILNVLFVALIIGNTPYTNMPTAKFPNEEVYLKNLPKMFIADVLAFFAIYPVIAFFKKTKDEEIKEKEA